MKSGVRVTKDVGAALAKRLEALAKKRVMVGIPADTTDREPDPDEPGPITNAMIGRINELGSPLQNIPARPWLVPGVEDATDEIVDRYKKGAQAILEGRVTDPDQVHHAVGLVAEAAVKKRITDGDFAPLAPATVKARKRRGRKSEKPLVDTGQLRNAATFVVRTTPGRK